MLDYHIYIWCGHFFEEETEYLQCQRSENKNVDVLSAVISVNMLKGCYKASFGIPQGENAKFHLSYYKKKKSLYVHVHYAVTIRCLRILLNLVLPFQTIQIRCMIKVCILCICHIIQFLTVFCLLLTEGPSIYPKSYFLHICNLRYH